MSEGAAYTFNSHRDALYKVLEAAARGQAGCADEYDIFGRDKQEGEKKLAFPTPLLWHEEIRPSDIDAYHAANQARCTSGCDNSNNSDDLRPLSPPTSRHPSSGYFNRSREALKEAGTSEGGAAALEGGLPPAPSAAAVVADRTSEPKAAAAAADHAQGEKQERLLGSGGASARTPDQSLGATTSNHPSCTKHRCRYQPGDTTGIHQEEEREEEGATAPPAASMDWSNSDGRSPSEAGEKKINCPSTMTPAATTPPDPSQATQTMFLPGLPSQVLVTQQQEQQEQQQGDAVGWEHSEGDESSQKEDDTPVSEYALSLPNHNRPCSSPEENTSKGASTVSAGDKQLGSDFRTERSEPDRNSSGDRDDPTVVSGDGNKGAVAAAAARERGEARSRQYDAFTRALRDFVGQQQLGREGDTKQAGSAQQCTLRNVSSLGGTSSSDGGGGGDQSKPPFIFLPTPEVLPSGWSGGQAGVVVFLEKHLSHVRERCPGGYAARALELACHTLRQPTVCVKAVDCARADASAARRADFFAGAATVDDDHPQVVGVAGFVWEMLRANNGGSANLAQQAASTSQEG
ncbi:unnamed protein product [Pylaiella littoralis]